MPDLGPVDDMIIEFAVTAQEVKEQIGPEDYFGQTRDVLHRLLGLN
ncbi:hypothetical protein [Jannaschia sp. AI_61]|nr:hypothetical protein [Jannaschia sp. AI_61]